MAFGEEKKMYFIFEQISVPSSPKVCNNSDQVAHSHILGIKLGFWHLADYRKKELKFYGNIYRFIVIWHEINAPFYVSFSFTAGDLHLTVNKRRRNEPHLYILLPRYC